MNLWLCENCKEFMTDSKAENGRCPRCGLGMEKWYENKGKDFDVEFDLMLTALLYGKKPQ